MDIPGVCSGLVRLTRKSDTDGGIPRRDVQRQMRACVIEKLLWPRLSYFLLLRDAVGRRLGFQGRFGAQKNGRAFPIRSTGQCDRAPSELASYEFAGSSFTSGFRPAQRHNNK